MSELFSFFSVFLRSMGKCMTWSYESINTLRQRQNGCHFADDISKSIFFNENVWILLKISLTFVPEVQINKIPALFQIMAWHRPGDKPLSEPVMVRLLTHICITRPQWVKHWWHNNINKTKHKKTQGNHEYNMYRTCCHSHINIWNWQWLCCLHIYQHHQYSSPHCYDLAKHEWHLQ